MNTNTPVPAGAQPKTPVELKLEWLMDDRRRITEHIRWLRAHKDILDAIDIAPSRFGEFIDFNNPNRKQILEIIKAFPGTWHKSLNECDAKTMDYKLAADGDVTLRIWGGELPPCCKIIEEWVYVPAQPARREIRKVVKCPELIPATGLETEVV